MGKIRVQDLAKKMGIPNQDLVFKLKSIGVRVEGDDAHIDTDIIQAILQGKKLPHPREVILRDAPQTNEAANLRRRMPRRAPTNPLRPSRPRTLIQKVEPKIQNLPVSRKAKAEPEKPAATEAVAAAAPAPAPAAPPEAPRKERPKKDKKGRRPDVPDEQAELESFRGAVEELDKEPEAPKAPVVPKTSRRKRRAQRKAEQKSTSTSEVSFAKGRPEGPVMISEGMTVREFADKLGIKSKELIKTLFQRGLMANINHVLETDLAEEIAMEFGIEAMIVSFEEEVQLNLESARGETPAGSDPRAPVVTIMGHVDHGKTSLLDAIRESRVAEGEHGGITQHIGAYEVRAGEAKDKKIVFVDTPGHEAFTMMRARGAGVTDIVVLVVAADDGVMPQTIEAIDHARAAKVPIIVAINKIDKENANPDRVKKELAERELLVEDWGGDTVSVEISALKRERIPDLLEMILLTADLLELKASPEIAAQGVVLEARKEVGRGIVATVLVQNGTLSVGDSFVAGATVGRVRAMTNDLAERITEAGPATPVEITGLTDVPDAGDVLQVVEDEVKARSIAEHRQQEQRRKDLGSIGTSKLSLEQLFDRIQEGEVKELPVVLKGDVQGSIEVLKDTLAKVGTDKVKVQVLSSGVGAVSVNDVLLASASNALIIGFNVRPERKAMELAEKEEVEIRSHTVIYELTEELRKAMAGLLDPTFREVSTGQAEVRETFKVPKIGTVAGCHVIDGNIPRNAAVRLLRDNVVVYEGKISSLRRFKDDVAEVRSGFDCGIGLERFQDVKPGDVIEAFVKEEVAATL
ncbi:MAG: translation initiation factor IF-2 [Acidobacteriota bacterium]